MLDEFYKLLVSNCYIGIHENYIYFYNYYEQNLRIWSVKLKRPKELKPSKLRNFVKWYFDLYHGRT